ncbi:hypothetical protein [Haloferula sp. BvORR071]|uniref:hypothetical protein n=1 Tax=Haloferula sp. BvORR071 TaxID=1396141 RepID=UPI00055818CB|nr:hypothetical protein [Haloferula sp. BvORR071]
MTKYLLLALSCLFSVVSCAPQPPVRGIFHIYQESSKLGSVSLFDLPEGPKAVSASFGEVDGMAKRDIAKSDFELIWNRLHSENLARFQVQDPSSKFDVTNSIVVKFGTTPVEKVPLYVVPKASASPALKATVAKIKKLAPL